MFWRNGRKKKTFQIKRKNLRYFYKLSLLQIEQKEKNKLEAEIKRQEEESLL